MLFIRPSVSANPRICREKSYSPRVMSSAIGSPPRMRGKDGAELAATVYHGITPAYAGKSDATFSTDAMT